MKKTVMIMLCVLLAFALFGCSEGETTEVEMPAVSEETADDYAFENNFESVIPQSVVDELASEENNMGGDAYSCEMSISGNDVLCVYTYLEGSTIDKERFEAEEARGEFQNFSNGLVQALMDKAGVTQLPAPTVNVLLEYFYYDGSVLWAQEYTVEF